MSIKRNVAEEANSFESIEKFEHIVFLGTFNADPFRAQIERWLPRLDLADVALIISDNHSTDDTFHWISEVISKLDCYSEITVNERNFGGYGNLAMNLEKFKKAKWVTTLHQDDEYAPQHVQNHRKVISKSDSNLGMICSEATSITPDGEKMGYPRAHWLLEDQSDPVTVFLAHLRNHVYPFSGATFSKDVLLRFPIPWHSTAFPDTEIVMKMAIEYKTSFARGVTVTYLENPASESHSLTPEHREFGAFQALIRVFAHPNYKKLCELLSKEEISGFLKSLDDGISQRFQDPLYSHLMKQAAFEITAQHIGTSAEMASYLAKGYLRVGDVRALDTLLVLGARISNRSPSAPETKPQVKSSPGPPRNVVLAVKFSAIMPRGLRRVLFKALMKIRIGKTILSNWDFDWKRK